MNLEKLKIINDIVNDSRSRIRESYFSKNHLDVLHEINKFCGEELNHLFFVQRMWHWVNDYPNLFKCKCGNLTSFNRNWKEGYRKSCSSKCAQDEVSTKEKRKSTNLKKYGVENAAMSQIVKDKAEKTNLDKYGHKSSFGNEQVKEKWRNNLKEKYGVDHVSKLEDFGEKFKSTMIERYGSMYVKTEEYKDKSKKTNLNKYGVEWYTQQDDWYENMKKANLERYGVEWYTQTPEWKERMMELKEYFLSISKERSIEFYRKLGFKLLGSSYDILTFEGKCGHVYEISRDTFYRRRAYGIDPCVVCHPMHNKSKQEIKIIDWIKSFGIDIIEGDRKICEGYELDILIPSHKLALEVNGLYWHSKFSKDKDYHLKKTLKCKENGIRLIHIWEDDWNTKEEIIKSMIKNHLGISDHKIYARKCEIKEVSHKEYSQFLIQNHIQGTTRSSASYGLYHNNELVSLMTFGNRSISGKKEYELIRFCNRINTSVIGSASKLFKHFLSMNDVSEITSFADISMFTGNLYQTLGFEFKHRSSINYWWVVNGNRFHRFNFNKKKLIKLGHDPLQTEAQIMHKKGHFKVFGCGQDKWVFKSNGQKSKLN